MAKLTIGAGATANDGSGDSLRSGAQKINNNFDELYASLGDGNSLKITTSGASNGEVLAFNGLSFVPTAVGGVNSFSSIISDNGSFSATTPGASLNIIGGSGIDTRITNNVLVIESVGGGGSTIGGASVTVSETPPASPNDGDLWYDSSLGVLAVWYNDQGYWVQTNSAAQIDTVTVSGGGTTGSSTFLELTDTPSAFIPDYIVKVNAEGTGLEFAESGGTGNAASAFTPLEIGGNYTAQVYDWIFADTSAQPITITLPTTANIGEEIRFLDTTGSFSTNNLTVQSNLKIQGDTQSFIVDIDYAGFSLVFVNTTIGWLLKDR